MSKHALPITILQYIMCKKLQLLGDFISQTPCRGCAPGPHWGTSISWSGSVYFRPLWGRISAPSPQKNSEIPPKFDETEEPEARIDGWITLTKILVPICLYCLNCRQFGQLILRKVVKIVASRCQILRPKCTKFDFGWGSSPDPAGVAYSTPPDRLAGFKGPTSKVREEEREGRDRRRGDGKRLPPSPLWNPKYTTGWII